MYFSEIRVSKWRLCISVGIAAVLAGTCSPGLAQSDDGAEGIQEKTDDNVIVVTARSRSEALIDAPVSVNAFDEATIEAAGITGMRDYASLSPNISLVETQNTGFAFVNIRGLSQVRNADPTVAVAIDGVLSTSGLGFSQELFDIQQIEVLKGPQGALYGRNATGGAINITTKRPSDYLEGTLRAGYGNGNTYSLSGSLSGPIAGDSLTGRLSASYMKSDGFRRNVTLGILADPYEDFSIRGKVLWEPVSNFSVDLRLAYSETESSPNQFFVNSPNFVLVPPVGGLPGIAHNWAGRANGTASIVPGQPASIARLIGDPNNTSVQFQGSTVAEDRRELWTGSAKIDWDLPFARLTATTAFDKVDSTALGQQGFPYFPLIVSSADPNPPPVAGSVVLPPSLYGALSGLNTTLGQNRFVEAVSQEIRLTSPDDQRFRWIVGGYFVKTDLDVLVSINRDTGFGSVFKSTEPNIGGTNPTATWNERFIATVAPTFSALFDANPAAIPAACLPGGGPLENLPDPVCASILVNPNTNAQALSFNFDRNDNTAYAFFGQLAYDLTGDLEISLALRYDNDRRKLSVATSDVYLPVFAFPSSREGEIRKRTYDSWQPKLTVRWKPDPDLTLYANYSHGFRSGGFNLSGVSVGIDTLTAAGVPGMPEGVEDSWDQEVTRGIDVGLKTVLLDGNLNFEIAGFYTKIDDAFAFSFVPPFNAQVIKNVDKAEAYGVEINATLDVTDHLKLDVAYGILESKILKSSFIGTGGIDIVGNDLPLNPKDSLNVAVTYNRPISSSVDGFIRADYKRIGKTPFEVENFIYRNPVDLIDVRGGISVNNQCEIVGWVRNLTNKDYASEFTNPNGISWLARPREYGVELKYSF